MSIEAERNICFRTIGAYPHADPSRVNFFVLARVFLRELLKFARDNTKIFTCEALDGRTGYDTMKGSRYE